jgi:hypothetical protein
VIGRAITALADLLSAPRRAHVAETRAAIESARADLASRRADLATERAERLTGERDVAQRSAAEFRSDMADAGAQLLEASDALGQLVREREDLARILRVELGAGDDEPLAAALRRVVEERDQAVAEERAAITAKMTALRELDAVRAEVANLREQLAREDFVRVGVEATRRALDAERTKDEALLRSERDAAIASAEAAQDLATRAAHQLAEARAERDALRAAARRLDDAFQNADHYPPAVAAMVEAARAR